MSDNKSKMDFRDRTRVSMDQPYEVTYWTEKWGITPQQLYDAIKATGSSSVKKLESYFKGNK